MELWQLSLIVGTLVATLIAFVWVAVRLGNTPKNATPTHKNIAADAINSSVETAFSEEFREELRQRARQQFEKLIHDNAMFLQQDIRMSAARLDDFMKKEVVSSLQQELASHHQTISQTQQMLTESLTKNQDEFRQDLAAEKERRIKKLDENLAEVVKKYIIAAVGDTLDVDKQLALVIDNLNAHKAEIIEDIRNHG